MSLLSSVRRPELDASARADVRSLVCQNQSRAALERLAEFEPAGREQVAEYQQLTAWALQRLGDIDRSLFHWPKALHATSRLPAARPMVRVCFADTLVLAGDLARAERMVHRCLAEIEEDPRLADFRARALGTLARIHGRRGTLTLAAGLFERAIAALGTPARDPRAEFELSLNAAHVFLRRGDMGRADEILCRIEAGADRLEATYLAGLLLTRLLFTLERGDVDRGEATLARLDDRVIGDYLRWRLIRQQYEGALRLAQGVPAEALAVLDQALAITLGQTPAMDDMVAEISRLRAQALLDLGRPEEALQAAREGLLAGGHSDLIDQPTGLRIVARCLAALGRKAEARQQMAAALSLLESTEFVVERRRLHADMQAVGMVVPGLLPASPATSTRDPGAVRGLRRLLLQDGRHLLTADEDLVRRLNLAAETRLPVLIEGETGTGKELAARLIHEMGSTGRGPFVVVDCTTLSESLAESELFGVVRGAFTGAANDRAGLVGAADGGTLFFDELPELSLPAQSKLLRLIQEGTYRRVGDAQPRQVAVRVIATSNQDTERLLATGRLKADLYFRLHGYKIRLRPLRERRSEIGSLAEDVARSLGLEGVTTEALAALETFSWPGNVRQLEMMVRAAAPRIDPGRRLGVDDLRDLLGEPTTAGPTSAERQRLAQALDANSGNVAAAARALGMSRQGLYKALHRNGLL